MSPRDEYRAKGFYLFRGAADSGRIARLVQAIDRDLIGSPEPIRRHDLSMKPQTYYDAAPDDSPELWRSGVFDAHFIGSGPHAELGLALRDVLESPGIFRALHELDGEPRYALHQSILFERSPKTGIHSDRTTFETDPPGRSFTVWISLQKILADNGPIFVYPWPLGYYPDEIWPRANPDASHADYVARESRAIRKFLANSPASKPVFFAFGPGDVLVMAPSTPHASLEAKPGHARRRSIQTIVRPASVPRWGAYPYLKPPPGWISEAESTLPLTGA